MLARLRSGARGAIDHVARRSGVAATTRGVSAAATFDSSKLTTTAASPTVPPPNEALVGKFGKIFTDHMLVIDWDAQDGWGAPAVVPYGNLDLSPAAMTLHYALQCFEGMKAYRGADGAIRLFRPDLNAARMNSSLTRLQMPNFEASHFVECLKALVKADAAWVPEGDGHAAYLRPTAIATDPFLGVGVPQRAKLFCIMSPVGPYYAGGFDPIAVFADAQNVRAWPGGSGNTKIGGNYAPTIKPAQDASKATAGKAQQVLYLFGDDHRVTEVGAMNVFVVWKTREGSVELVTAPLDYGDILPGVTRRSVLDLAAADPAGVGVDAAAERAFTMPEVRDAANEGRLLEVFGAGTAAVICPVNEIFYEGASVNVPTGAGAGPVASSLWKKLSDIQYGRTASDWAVAV
mmetsp:Transcript_23149/g.71555  ORF Transcript_23149/g.71555 Transcript_23149/m.71555 type:complete len:404 (-) Transcript_23149:66-1277(-)